MPAASSCVNRAQALEASRHLCQEARVVLTTLRGGPPNVARGDLAQGLIDARGFIKQTLSNALSDKGSPEFHASTPVQSVVATSGSFAQPEAPMPPKQPASSPPPAAANVPSGEAIEDVSTPTKSASAASRQDIEEEENSVAGSAVMVQMNDAESPLAAQKSVDIPQNPKTMHMASPGAPVAASEDVGPFARPFLAVVMDPRAAGPHTLVALRALHRLLERGSLQLDASAHCFTVALEPLTKGVLSCKFEQTDAGADEAVEMAIADLLALLVSMDRRAIRTETLMDAFNTVFVTRNTFVHSPALCYHFEDVLTTMIKAVFRDLTNLYDPTARLILEFLVSQLLHTPMVGGDDEASRDAQIAHDATRVLCLRLARGALCEGFQNLNDSTLSGADISVRMPGNSERSLLQIVRDDLCLSLLMTGQAIWASQEENSVSPGFISLEVLSEICATLSTLWTTLCLRKFLIPQFEAIFTGFYQRGLVLLQKRVNPVDSVTFHANVVFDAGLEIILESLVDIMCLHDHRQTVAQGEGGALETLFATYDCHMKRSDVAVGLMVELCRCCGSQMDEEGVAEDLGKPPPVPAGATFGATAREPEAVDPTPNAGAPPLSNPGAPPADGETAAEQWRHVPPHLKELCAEAIMGGMKYLFRDDQASEKTLAERRQRSSILSGHVEESPKSLSFVSDGAHRMREIKSRKRLMRKAAQLFNKKSSKGIKFLVESGLLPEPPTPRSVASFLRNGIVVGLDKPAVGSYLGEVGKSPVAGNSPPNWERDWFHKEVLSTYCSLFHFEGQTLLDCLRMFLAAFRLPGEAQQIDRILQAFADSCSQCCDESVNGRLKLFSEDPKKASDQLYLLSFSIIMLNTDQHNDNIREDRKMKISDFVKNNTDYGMDITEKGKEFPREFLESIYSGIRDEEIRTEGEGADGCMTVERWKDVLRGSVGEDSVDEFYVPTESDTEDLAELVLEHVCMPIMSAVGALWNAGPVGDKSTNAPTSSADDVPTGMLRVQGARLGMDMTLSMLVGVRQLGRIDIFRRIFACVCRYSGLLSYASNAANRTWSFANSVGAQSAVIIALRVARDASAEIGVEGWRFVWSILFELRDLKMIGGGVVDRSRSILMESEPDLLKEDARREWVAKCIKIGTQEDNQRIQAQSSGVTSVFGAMGRALFGNLDDQVDETVDSTPLVELIRTIHGKEEQTIWDELAPSDDEDEDQRNEDVDISFTFNSQQRLSVGAQFESQIIQEDMLIQQQRELPVTGLERAEDSRAAHVSPRASVRKRLSRACDFVGLISESRLVDEDGIGNLLSALLELIPPMPSPISEGQESAPQLPANKVPLSPASEAFAEVLLCEIILRNRYRLNLLWPKYLKAHYSLKLESVFRSQSDNEKLHPSTITASTEKCVTGLLRLSSCVVQRGGIANDILDTWKLLGNVIQQSEDIAVLTTLDKHMGEGLWRISRNIDDTAELSNEGWDGLLSLLGWCTHRGAKIAPESSDLRPVGLAEDDPALQAYRSLHYIMNSSEVKSCVPASVIHSIRSLIAAGELRHCPKLSIAALDLIQIVNQRVESSTMDQNLIESSDGDLRQQFWTACWRPAIEYTAEASEVSAYPTVRQHSLSILADSFLDKREIPIPPEILCSVLGELCIPLAGRRIASLRKASHSPERFDSVMIELELCIGLIFKPLRHHLKSIADPDSVMFLTLWKTVLSVTSDLLVNPELVGADGAESGAGRILKVTNDLTLEHLRNVIIVLVSMGILHLESLADDITTVTWNAVSKMECGKDQIEEWKKAAMEQQQAQ